MLCRCCGRYHSPYKERFSKPDCSTAGRGLILTEHLERGRYQRFFQCLPYYHSHNARRGAIGHKNMVHGCVSAATTYLHKVQKIQSPPCLWVSSLNPSASALAALGSYLELLHGLLGSRAQRRTRQTLKEYENRWRPLLYGCRACCARGATRQSTVVLHPKYSLKRRLNSVSEERPTLSNHDRSGKNGSPGVPIRTTRSSLSSSAARRAPRPSCPQAPGSGTLPQSEGG